MSVNKKARHSAMFTWFSRAERIAAMSSQGSGELTTVIWQRPADTGRCCCVTKTGKTTTDTESRLTEFKPDRANINKTFKQLTTGDHNLMPVIKSKCLRLML